MDDLPCGMDEGRGERMFQEHLHGKAVLFRDAQRYRKKGHAHIRRQGIFHGIQDAAVSARKLPVFVCRRHFGDTEKRDREVLMTCHPIARKLYLPQDEGQLTACVKTAAADNSLLYVPNG